MIYPYNFVNDKYNKDFMKNIISNYVDSVPGIEYFPEHVTTKEYVKYLLSFKSPAAASVPTHWNLKNETIKYCENDCLVLYKVIETFNKYIFDLFKLNIHNCPTLPSLAFAWRLLFLDLI